ncbi:MAG: hypothetical protein KC613_24840, partial [Myxococcales bacterium]|nr:hypothetical protein [Myxococcales bacterium]
LDRRAEGDALVRVTDQQAELQVVWPAEPGCGRQVGPLYRGAEHPLLWGGLITYDPCAQAVFLSKRAADERLLDAPVLALPGPVIFGTGWAGRPLALTPAGLARLEEAAPDRALGWPARLSETGCFADLPTLAPGPDLIPYRLRAPLWTDGAVKRRYLVLPPGQPLAVADDGRLDLPVGSVILKDFAFLGPDGLRSVETRTMTRYPFGWGFHTWRWDDDGRDATRLAGAEAEWRDLTVPDDTGAPAALRYLYPSRSNCLACHDPIGPTVLGPTLAQLSQPDGSGVLPALQGAGLLPADVSLGDPRATPLPDPADPTLSVGERARAYLHGNCAHCHRPGGWTPPNLGMDLRFDTPLAAMGVCDVPRRYASFGIPGDVRIAAGDPDGSYLLQRMLHRGYGQMPPVATERVDPLVEPVFRAWIEALVCP